MATKLRLPRASTVCFVVSMSLAAWLYLGRPTPQPKSADASVRATTATSVSKPISLVKPISNVQLGERAIGRNPIREQVEDSLPQPDPATWRKLTLRMSKGNDRWLTIELLRSIDWIYDVHAVQGGMIHLDMDEMGAIGNAEVLSIEPCPPIQPGKGNVVTGKFVHEVTKGEIIELWFANQPEPIRVTANHPHWSVDREDFIAAGELREGEHVDCLNGIGTTTVTSITPSDYSGAVYNLEIHGEHVYRVGTLGILAHNKCAVKPYGPQSTNGGHHIFSKKAFEGMSGYDPLKALAIPKSEIARLGLRHLEEGGMTATQRRLFGELAASGRANTLKEHARIAEQALIEGGLSKAESKSLVKQALDQLKSWGIKAPANIPWN